MVMFNHFSIMIIMVMFNHFSIMVMFNHFSIMIIMVMFNHFSIMVMFNHFSRRGNVRCPILKTCTCILCKKKQVGYNKHVLFTWL